MGAGGDVLMQIKRSAAGTIAGRPVLSAKASSRPGRWSAPQKMVFCDYLVVEKFSKL
jgi:hypothetical protein